jgi:hypothetical protein
MTCLENGGEGSLDADGSADYGKFELIGQELFQAMQRNENLQTLEADVIVESQVFIVFCSLG